MQNEQTRKTYQIINPGNQIPIGHNVEKIFINGIFGKRWIERLSRKHAVWSRDGDSRYRRLSCRYHGNPATQ